MRILMVASEATPFAKTGGLADVIGSLSPALRSLGHEVAIVLPRYRGIEPASASVVISARSVWMGGVPYVVSVLRRPEAAPYYLVDCPSLYDRDQLYGDATGDYPDNAVRFALLSRAALLIARDIFRPNVLHCHDWQTGLVPTYLNAIFANDPGLIGIKTLFTIHNLGYQGIFPKEVLGQVGLDAGVFHPNGLEFFGKVSYIKGGLNYARLLNTVSKRYALEIQTPEYGFGLDGLLHARRADLTGILNGVDYSQWNPETDPYIASHYSAQNLEGKARCKQELLREFELPSAAISRPLIGIVSRFTSQKGIDLIAPIVNTLADDDVYLVALGNGDPVYEALFQNMAEENPDHISVRLGWHEPLAHKIEAGADMFLMPSRYEPCGLNQIYSLRYGTVPIVRATGGLDDTIEEGTGFKFEEFSGLALLRAIRTACSVFEKRDRWRAMMVRGMNKDYSWNASAREYSSLYQRLVNLSDNE